MIFAICYSPNWRPHVEVEVKAILATNPLPLKIYLISEKGGEIDLPHTQFVDVTDLFAKRIPTTTNVSSRFTKYALFRLLLPEIIPEDRVIYVDADAIVNGDLTDFHNMDLGQALIAGVPDTGITPQQKTDIGLNAGDLYINTGVTLMDLSGIRAANLPPVWLKLINTRPFSCHDQDVLNLTCKGRIETVPDEYNVSLSTTVNIPEDDVKIMHWAGAKPWDIDTVPHYSLWRYWATQAGPAHLPQPIPKIIHTCWFGRKPMPTKAKRCMDSWRRHMPDFDIRVHNEDDFDPASNTYTLAAYTDRKWAFVTDFVRLDALYHTGGIYMDTDVEVLQPLDRFLTHRAFTGHETPDLWVTATMGAEPGHPWIEHLRNFYLSAPYDGWTPNTQTITRLSQPWLEREVYGFKYLRDGVVIYPTDQFCGFNHQAMKPIITPNSYAIHLFSGSWLNNGEGRR